MTDRTIKHPALINGHLKYDHLLGLEYIQGVQDCYTMPQRMFKDNLGIELTNYARPDDWWIDDNLDLYNNNFRSEGFNLIEISNLSQLRILDCFLIAIPDSRRPERTVANHCAIYVGNGMIVHHRVGKLSQKVPYRGMWLNFTTAVVRHKDVPNLLETNIIQRDLTEFLLPHKRELIESILNDTKTDEILLPSGE